MTIEWIVGSGTLDLRICRLPTSGTARVVFGPLGALAQSMPHVVAVEVAASSETSPEEPLDDLVNEMMFVKSSRMDCLYGDDGDDRLNGGAGYDCLYGDAGQDLLVGRDLLSDHLCDNPGDNFLSVGTGGNYLEGGASFDFVYVDLAKQSEADFALKASAPMIRTLRDALVEAYRANPKLIAECANLRATDGNVPIARAAGLPGLGSVGAIERGFCGSNQGAFGVGVDLSIPVYGGGSMRGSARAVTAHIDCGYPILHVTEANLFARAAAQADILRNEAILRVHQENIRTQESHLQAARDGFEAGDKTRADLTRAEAHFALAQANLRSAEAQLIGSRETYIRVAGAPHGVTVGPPADSPAGTAHKDIEVARAGRLPYVGVNTGEHYYEWLEASKRIGGGTASQISLIALPLFEGSSPILAEAKRTGVASVRTGNAGGWRARVADPEFFLHAPVNGDPSAGQEINDMEAAAPPISAARAIALFTGKRLPPRPRADAAPGADDADVR